MLWRYYSNVGYFSPLFFYCPASADCNFSKCPASRKMRAGEIEPDFFGRRPADEWGSILSRSNVSDGLAIVARVARHIRARNAVAITARCRPSSRIKRKTKENDLSFDPLFICLLRRHLSRRKRESEEEEEEGGLICIRFG